jgi:hypothetical protein
MLRLANPVCRKTRHVGHATTVVDTEINEPRAVQRSSGRGAAALARSKSVREFDSYCRGNA